MADGVKPLVNQSLDVASIRAQFPALNQNIYGNKPLVYLDSAASSQKPEAVLRVMDEFQRQDYSNVHRGVHCLSQRATDAFEASRETVAQFLSANVDEIVFTKSTTEAINLVAHGMGELLHAGDEIILTELEHHANIIPWQLAAQRKGFTIKVVPILDDGQIDFDAFKALLSDKTKLVACAYVSNVLGTVLPVADIIENAHAVGAQVLLDASQAVTHRKVDVKALDVDYLVFTGHKLYGPTGIGVLYGRHELLQALPPYQGGGDMIDRVSFDGSTFKDAPFKFEAGTPAITEAIGLGAAIDWVSSVGLDNIAAHEDKLLRYAHERLAAFGGVRIHGQAPDKVSVVSFTLDNIHAIDAATILDKTGVAVRVGQHCAEPLHDRLGVASTARASFAAYNNFDDVDALIDGLGVVRELFS